MKRLIQLVTALALLITIATVSSTKSSYAQSGTPAATAAASAAPTGAATTEPELSVKAGNLPAETTLTLAGFSVIREAFAEIIPAFQKYWTAKTGQTVTFKESYQASGAQSRAVVGGLKGGCRRAVARSRCDAHRDGQIDHQRLEEDGDQRCGEFIGGRACGAQGQPEGHQGVGGPREAGRRDHHAEPGHQRRRTVEPAGCLWRGQTRTGCGCPIRATTRR